MPVNEQLHEKIKKEVFDIASNISEIIRNYKDLKHPLMESQEKVPEATEHLDKISEQTEAAAHQMLDTVEKLTQREEEVIEGLNLISKEVTGDNAEKIRTMVNSLIEKATENNNDTFAIMDALQFQDITTQQLHFAVHMLEELQKKLGKILVVMSGDDSSLDDIEKEINSARAYDPNADLFSKKTEQSDIDNIFAKKA